MYYKVCDKCRATLDPAEHCDCEHEKERKLKEVELLYTKEKRSNQLSFNFEERRMV